MSYQSATRRPIFLSLVAVGLAGLTTIGVANAQNTDASRFDGKWTAYLNCPSGNTVMHVRIKNGALTGLGNMGRGSRDIKGEVALEDGFFTSVGDIDINGTYRRGGNIRFSGEWKDAEKIVITGSYSRTGWSESCRMEMEREVSLIADKKPQKTDYRTIVDAARAGKTQAIRGFLSNGIAADTQFGGSTALIAAAGAGHYGAVALLANTDIDIDHQLPNGTTALYAAAQTGAGPVVDLLLSKGADARKAGPIGADGRPGILAMLKGIAPTSGTHADILDKISNAVAQAGPLPNAPAATTDPVEQASVPTPAATPAPVQNENALAEKAKTLPRQDAILVQKALIKFGYLDGSADGAFGPKSQAAIRDLARETGLSAVALIDVLATPLPQASGAETAQVIAPTRPRLALVIGNNEYKVGPLLNPVNDARLIAKSLKAVGFKVQTHEDLDFFEFGRVVADFGRELKKAGEDAVGLFFYAGHAVQSQGENYLIPVDVELNDELDLPIKTVSTTFLMRSLEAAGNKLNMVFLDACRNNPFRSLSRSVNRGLARIDAPFGTLISYSTAPGAVATDGTGRNSPYSAALSRAMRKPNQPIEQALKQVRLEVLERTAERQIPWESSSLTGNFFFKQQTETTSGQPKAGELAFWSSIQGSKNPVLFQSYLDRFPNGLFADVARVKVAEGGN